MKVTSLGLWVHRTNRSSEYQWNILVLSQVLHKGTDSKPRVSERIANKPVSWSGTGEKETLAVGGNHLSSFISHL